MGELVQSNAMNLPLRTRAPGEKVKNELGGGIQSSFGLVKISGKGFINSYRGEIRPILRADGDPAASIEVVIVKASSVVGKTYYADGFKEGSKEGPDCFSEDGVTPSPRSKAKQHATCLTCPKNVFGTGRDAAGNPTKGKACRDNKRVAIVPYPDIRNEFYGGPMLIRIPPASLQEFLRYGEALADMGYYPHEVVTKIGFDPTLKYPKFVFTATQVLSPAEIDQIEGMRSGDMVARILSEDVVGEHGEETPAVTPQVASVAALPPKAKAESKPAPKPAPVQAEPEPSTLTTPIDESLDAQLDALMGK